MAISVTNSGTTSALSATPLTLATRTDGKTYVCQLDLNNLAVGDVAIFEVEVKVLAGSTARVTDRVMWSNTLSGQPVFISVPYPAPYSIAFKLSQPTGTGRTVDYSILSID